MNPFGGSNITGLGVVSAAGLGVRPLFDACVAGHSCLAMDAEFALHTGRIPAVALATVRARLEESPEWRTVFAADLALPDELARPALLTAYALMEALGDEGPRGLGQGTGLIFATTTGHMHRWEKELPGYVAGELTPSSFAPAFSDHHLSRSLDAVMRRTGFSGPFQVLTSACAAGTQALALAHSWLATGKVDRVLVGSTEVLTTLTMRGFGCFNLLTPTIAAPFDRQRAGINLSEAAVFLRLERQASRPSLGYVLGGGTAMDAFDMTRPHPEGRGIHKAMSAALAQAKATPTSVNWVYAHGTGTPANDVAEGAAIAMLFGASGPPVSSTKAIHGHALGASGLLETAIALEAMARDVIPPTTNLKELDPVLRLDVTTAPRTLAVDRVMKTTLGFGGVNAAVLLGREPLC